MWMNSPTFKGIHSAVYLLTAGETFLGLRRPCPQLAWSHFLSFNGIFIGIEKHLCLVFILWQLLTENFLIHVS